MSFHTSPGAELIPGYRLVERLGTGGFGEVWKATAPGGLTKALKIVFGHMEESRASQELKALDRIKTVRHPFLLSLERVEIIDNQLLIVTELADRSLLDRFQECRSTGLPGIPRPELLLYMRDAAEALDYMNESFGLQHLDIKPQNLLLVGGRIKIADFGLVKDLRGGSATITGGVTPFYATPEAFDGRVSRFSDQYSLAIVYQEMLTGLRPYPGTTALQLALQHGSSNPLLHPLPLPDRPIIARALSKVPDQRFPTCRDMVAGLVECPEEAPPLASAEENAANVHSPQRRKSVPSVKRREIAKPPTAAPEASDRTPIAHGHLTPLAPQPTPQGEAVHKATWLSLTKPASDTGLRPTLLVGLGGIAGFTLGKLRQKLCRQFGDLRSVPVLRLLLLDTDRAALQEARQGEIGQALEVDETLPMPLQRPEHYRKQSGELLKWLERHWLYNIPRSLLTEGLRPLGRLALVSHLDQLLPHLSELVTAVNNSEARAATERTTGVTVRGDSPQVFVVASSAGGTGSGGVVDLAYAVRRVLQGLNLPHARVCGILIHATNQNPAEADLARLNTFVTLHELGHYNRSPSTYLGAAPQGRRAAGPNIPPFDDCYVVHLGDQLSSADIQNCVNEVAEYLYANMATPVGAFLERWRRASAKANPKDEDAQGLRSFGLHRYGFPKNRLAKLAAGRFCRDFIERWLGEHLDCSEDSMRADICARMASLGLEPQAIEKLFCAAALRVLGDDAEKYFLEKIARLPPVPPGEDVRKRFSADIISGVLTRIDAFFAMTPDDPLRAANAVTPLESALAELCRELTGNLGRPTLQWLISKLDNPQRRLRGAYHAANVVRQQINAGAASVTHQLEQVRAHQITVRDALMAGNAKKVESDLVWLGGRPACQGADKSVQQFAEYFLFRLKERTLRRTQQVLDALAARLAEWNTELEAINLKLRTFAETFLPPDSTLDAPASALRRCPAQTELLPPGAQSLLDAAGQIAARVTPEAVAEFDQLFQEEIVNSYGGLWGFTCSMEENEDRLREALLQRASEALLPALAEFDAAQLLLESWTDAQRGKQEIKDRAAATAPRLDLPGAQRQLIIGLPKSTAGTALHEILDPASFTVPSTLLDTDGDILFCAESAALPIDQTAEFLVHDPERYREVAAQVTTRKDVPWSFLELSETNP